MMCVTGIPLHKSSKKQKVKHTNDAPKLNLACSNVSSLAGPEQRVKLSRAGFKCAALGRIIVRGPYPASNAIIYMH